MLRGHKALLSSATFSADGTQIVTAADDNTARIWDASTGQELNMVRGRTSAAFTPDGRRVVTVGIGAAARIWDAAQPTGDMVLHHDAPLFMALFRADGTKIITASDSTGRIWDANSGQVVTQLRGHLEAISEAHFSFDGSRVVTSSFDKTARLWDAATGEQLLTLSGHEMTVWSANFSRDGRSIATASADKTARIWDAGTGKERLRLLGHDEIVGSVCFSPDDKRILTSGLDGKVRIWDASTGTPLRVINVIRGPGRHVSYAAFSFDGKQIVTSTYEGGAVWNAQTGERLFNLRGEGGVVGATFSRDGTRIIGAIEGDNTPRIWDGASGQELLLLRGHSSIARSAFFSPDETRVITSSWDKTVRIWDSIPYRQRYPKLQRAKVNTNPSITNPTTRPSNLRASTSGDE